MLVLYIYVGVVCMGYVWMWLLMWRYWENYCVGVEGDRGV